MGCVNSRHRPFRRKSTTLKESSEEKRSSRIDSSRRIDDWIQPEDGFDRLSNSGDAKVRLIESEMFSTSRCHDHQIGKILENPATVAHMDRVVHDQELRRASSAVVDSDLDIDPKVVKAKLDRWNSKDSKVRLIESEKLSSSMFSEHHQIEKGVEKPEVEASVRVVHRELKRGSSIVSPKDAERKQVAAGWPSWLVSVAGESLVDWAPRRANTFEKLEKVSFFCYHSLVQILFLFNRTFFLMDADWPRNI
jgi:hypothetical protein